MNAFLVEVDDGVVAVEVAVFVSDARACRARLDALGTPLAGVPITRPLPDHSHGLSALVAGYDVACVALADVYQEIHGRDVEKRQRWAPVLGDQWPATSIFPPVWTR